MIVYFLFPYSIFDWLYWGLSVCGHAVHVSTNPERGMWAYHMQYIDYTGSSKDYLPGWKRSTTTRQEGTAGPPQTSDPVGPGVLTFRTIPGKQR